MFKSKKKEKPKPPFLIWRDSVITDENPPGEFDGAGDIPVWNILGKEYRFITKDNRPVPLPEIEATPEYIAGMVGCLPRQRLNAARNKDIYEKLAPYAPVAAIGIVCLVAFIMLSE